MHTASVAPSSRPEAFSEHRFRRVIVRYQLGRQANLVTEAQLCTHRGATWLGEVEKVMLLKVAIAKSANLLTGRAASRLKYTILLGLERALPGVAA